MFPRFSAGAFRQGCAAYSCYYAGRTPQSALPVGPICSSGLESIIATINPASTDYYYFVADKNKKTYYAKNQSEFNAIINDLKNQGLWYVYD